MLGKHTRRVCSCICSKNSLWKSANLQFFSASIISSTKSNSSATIVEIVDSNCASEAWISYNMYWFLDESNLNSEATVFLFPYWLSMMCNSGFYGWLNEIEVIDLLPTTVNTYPIPEWELEDSIEKSVITFPSESFKVNAEWRCSLRILQVNVNLTDVCESEVF